MTAVDIAVVRLKVEEGYRGALYRDGKGRQTIGYGFCVDSGMTRYAAEALLLAQTQEAAAALAAYPWYQGLDPMRASVFLDIVINDGLTGMLHFVNTIHAVGLKDWQMAHDELLDSDAARLLPARYNALAGILLSGVQNVAGRITI